MPLTVYCIGPAPDDGAAALQQALVQRAIPARVKAVAATAASVNHTLSTLLQEEDLLGALIQRPFKQTALAYCQELTHSAQILGGVTVLARRSSGLVHGDNTDMPAFTGALAEQGIRHVRTALVLGAGQAARIALAGLRELNCARYLVGYRNPRRPAELGNQLRALKKQLNYFPLTEMGEFFGWASTTGLFAQRPPLTAPGQREDGVKRWDLLVNATPVGMADGEIPLVNGLSFLRCFSRVFDMVPRDSTPLTLAAGAAGVPALAGLRVTELAEQYALNIWEREHRRRTLAAEGKLDVFDEPARPVRLSPHPPRVPVLKRRNR